MNIKQLKVLLIIADGELLSEDKKAQYENEINWLKGIQYLYDTDSITEFGQAAIRMIFLLLEPLTY